MTIVLCKDCKSVVVCASRTGLFCGHPKIGIYVLPNDSCVYGEAREEP